MHSRFTKAFAKHKTPAPRLHYCAAEEYGAVDALRLVQCEELRERHVERDAATLIAAESHQPGVHVTSTANARNVCGPG